MTHIFIRNKYILICKKRTAFNLIMSGERHDVIRLTFGAKRVN